MVSSRRRAASGRRGVGLQVHVLVARRRRRSRLFVGRQRRWLVAGLVSLVEKKFKRLFNLFNLIQ